MDEQTRGFRSAIFGGFNREDVMHYIEETDTKYYTETAELRSQLTEAQSAMNELRTQNEALTAKNAELLERLGEMTLDTDKIRAQLDQIESGFSLQATEIEAQNAPRGAACGGKRPADLRERQAVGQMRRIRCDQREDRRDGAFCVPARQADRGGCQG